MGEYMWFLIAIVLCGIFAAAASSKVNKTYNKMQGITTKSRMTGRDTALKLLRDNGVEDIAVGKVGGQLTDHYHPTKKQVNLSICLRLYLKSSQNLYFQ